jgi:hypothetical protein
MVSVEFRTSWHCSEDIWMICRMSSRRFFTGFLGRSTWLRDGQKDFCVLVIILFASSYSDDTEEGSTHEEI